MKKFSVSAVLTGVLLGVPGVVDAAYPVYPAYQPRVGNGQMAVPANVCAKGDNECSVIRIHV